jgi:hypothetical protein
MTTTLTINDVGPALERCRQDIANFKRSRLITEAAMNGILPCKATPEQFRDILLRSRDPLQERVAAEQHRAFLQMLYKREPTAEELRAGPPTFEELKEKLVEEGLMTNADDSMGIPPLVLPIAAVVGGAFGLSSLFSYLAGRESGGHREAGVVGSVAREARDWKATAKAWALPVGLAAGVSVLGYFWLSRKYAERAAKAGAPRITVKSGEPKALPPKSEMRQNVGEPEVEEPDEDELEDEEPEIENEGGDDKE